MAKYTTADLDAVRREREAKGTYTSGRRADGEKETQLRRVDSVAAKLQQQLNPMMPHTLDCELFAHQGIGFKVLQPTRNRPQQSISGRSGGIMNALSGAPLIFPTPLTEALRARMQAQAQKDFATCFFVGRCPKCGRVHDMDAICEKVKDG